MNKILCNSLDYEAEYHRLLEEHKMLCDKHETVMRDFKALESEFSRIRAQLDIVYLIFGKR